MTENIGLTLPDRFYRYLDRLKQAADNVRHHERSTTYLYRIYTRVMDEIEHWLLDYVSGTAYRIIRLTQRTIVLQPSNHPLDAYWTIHVTHYLSEKYNLSRLWDLRHPQEQ